MKKLLWLVLVVGLLAVLAVVLLLSNLGSVIKAAVERFGSDATKAKVTLADAEVSLTDGQGALRGLVVGNPAGYKTPSAFELGEVSLVLDTASVTQDVIVVREVVVAAPKITWELDGSLRSNIGTIQDNADAYAKSLSGSGGKSGGGRDGGNDGAKGSGKDGGKDGGKKFVIENFRVRDGKIAVSATIAGGNAVTVPLPDIHVRDLGREGGGLTAEEVTAKILDILSSSTIEAAARNGVQGAVRGVLEGAVDRAKGVLEKAKDLFK